MKTKAIFGLLALFVAILGFSSATYAAIGLNQGAEVQVGEGWGNVVEAKDLPKHTANAAGKTSNIAAGDGWSLDVVIDASQNWTVVATGNVPEGSFPLFVQKGEGNDTNVYKSTITISKDVEGNRVINLGSGLGTYSVNEVRWGSFVQTTPVPVPDNCDTSKVSGGVASWLEENGINGADCFDYAVEQRCGYLNVSITKQPMPLYAKVPFRAVYTLNGQVASPYSNFPRTFDEDFNGGSVDVTWFTVGPEKDWLIDTTFPNFWSNVGRTITVDTDCKEESTPAAIEAVVKCATYQDQAKIELTLTNSGETAGEVSVNGEIVNVPAKSSVVNYFDSKTNVKVVDGEEVILDQTLDCTPGQGGGGTTPETPKTPETPETPKTTEAPETPKTLEAPESPKSPESPIVLPNTFGASTPLVSAGALSFASLILVAGTAIKSRLLA